MLPVLRAAAAATSRPARRPLLKTAAALFRQVVAAVVYGYLTVAWAHSLGVAVEIVGRWTYGEGSAAEAIGAAVRAASWVVLVRLFPVFFPLLLVRAYDRAEFERKEEERKEREVRRGKLASNEQLLKRGEIRLPKGISLAPFYMSAPLCQLLCLAISMKHTEGHESLMWMGSLLCDVAYFGLAISTGAMVQNIMILVTVPKLRDGDDVMQ